MTDLIKEIIKRVKVDSNHLNMLLLLIDGNISINVGEENAYMSPKDVTEEFIKERLLNSLAWIPDTFRITGSSNYPKGLRFCSVIRELKLSRNTANFLIKVDREAVIRECLEVKRLSKFSLFSNAFNLI